MQAQVRTDWTGWTAAPSESWHGFTVDALGPGSAVTPEPLSIALLATGLAGVARRRWRREQDGD